MSSSEACPSQRINELYWGFTISRAIHIAAKFGIADYVAKNTPLISEIAKRTYLNEIKLYRLIRLLASYKIFQETDKSIFIATPQTQVPESPSKSIRHTAHMATQSMWEAYEHLEYCLNKKRDAYTDSINKGVFKYLDEQVDDHEEIANVLNCFSDFENTIIAKQCKLEQIQSIVDIGGGQGSFLRELLNINLHSNGILFDQTHVINDAPNLTDHPSLSQRLDKVGGDFFKHIPEKADAYFLKRILNDWNDRDCSRILENVRNAMTPFSRLYIIDAVVPPSGHIPYVPKSPESSPSTWDRQERDRQEFEVLLSKAGLELITMTETPSALSIIEAKVANSKIIN